MKVHVTKLYRVVVSDAQGRSQTLVLRPGDRIDGYRDAGPAGLVTVQEVSNLKRLLGDQYHELIRTGVIREEQD